MGSGISETGGPIPELFLDEDAARPSADILDFLEWGRRAKSQKEARQAEKDRRRQARAARAEPNSQLKEDT